ncbi:MAG: hypothetical protein U9R08_05695 [Nanoarchaeota archaeon]|nr:hypothetical protein [Nanoarchaeota archaeon]
MKKLIPILIIITLFSLPLVLASPEPLPDCCPSTFNSGAAYVSYLEHMNERYPGYSNEVKEERAQSAAESFANGAKYYIDSCQAHAGSAQKQYESGIAFCNELKPRASFEIGLYYYDCKTKSIKRDKLNEKVAEMKERTKTGSSYGMAGTVDRIELWENRGEYIPNVFNSLRDQSLTTEYFSEPDVMAQAFENCVGSINLIERCGTNDKTLLTDYGICMKAEMREQCYLRYHISTRNWLLEGCRSAYEWAWDEEWWSGVTGKTLDEPVGDYDYKLEFDLKKNKLNLDGEDYIPVTIKMTKKTEKGKVVPAANELLPTVMIEHENNAYIGEIVGDLDFALVRGQKQVTDKNGIINTKIIATKTNLGPASDKLGEVKIYVYGVNAQESEQKKVSFGLEVPPIKIKRVYKPNRQSASAGAYNALTIEVDDPSNLKKTYYITAGAGTLKYGDKITKGNKMTIKTTDNIVNFGWAPPDMTRNLRINQLKTFKKHLMDLKEKALKHYDEKLTDSITERFVEDLPESVQNVLQMVENANDKISKKDDLVKYLDGSIKTLNDMEGQYFKLFEHDVNNPAEYIGRGALMAIGSKEVVDGAVGLVMGDDEDIKGIAQSKGIDALKDYLSNELEIVDAAKGREWMKSYNIRVTVKAGGATDSITHSVPAKGLEVKYTGK